MNVSGKEAQSISGYDERIPFAWKVYTSNGRPDTGYYFNTITGETVWNVPVKDLAIVEKRKKEAAIKGSKPISIPSSKETTSSNRSSPSLLAYKKTSRTGSGQAEPSQSLSWNNHWPRTPEGSPEIQHLLGIQPPKMDELQGPSGRKDPAKMHFSDPRGRAFGMGLPSTAEVEKEKHPRIQIPDPAKKTAMQTLSNRCGPSYKLTILDAKLLIQSYFKAEISPTNNGRKLYIVLDKLFLIEHLTFVTYLQLAIHQVRVDGTILVPKEVLLELDEMQTDKAARSAIRFINHLNDTDPKFVVDKSSLQTSEHVKLIFNVMQSRQNVSNSNAFTIMRCMQLGEDDHVVVLLTTDPDLESYGKGMARLSVLLYSQIVELLHRIKDMLTVKKLNNQVPATHNTSISNEIAAPKRQPKTQNIDISKVAPPPLAGVRTMHKRTIQTEEPPKDDQITEKKLKVDCTEPNELMSKNGELIDAKAKDKKAERKRIIFSGEDTIWKPTKVIDSSKSNDIAADESTSVAKPVLQVKPTHREVEMQALMTFEQQQYRNNNERREQDDGQSDSEEVSESEYWNGSPSITVLRECFRSIRTKMEHTFKLIIQTSVNLCNWNSKEPILSDLLDILLQMYSYSGNTGAEWIMCKTISLLKSLVLKNMCGGLKAVKLIQKSHLIKFYELSYKTSKQLKAFYPEMVDLDETMLEIQNIGRQLRPMTQPSDSTAPVVNAPAQNSSNTFNNQNRSNTSNYSDDETDGPPAVYRSKPPPLLGLNIARPYMLNEQTCSKSQVMPETSLIKNFPNTNNDRNYSNFVDNHYSLGGQQNSYQSPPNPNYNMASYIPTLNQQSGVIERTPKVIRSSCRDTITERQTKKNKNNFEDTDENYNRTKADCSRVRVDKQSLVEKDCYPSTSSFNKPTSTKSHDEAVMKKPTARVETDSSSDSDESDPPTSPCKAKAAVAQVKKPIKKAIVRKPKIGKKLLIKKPVRPKFKFENLSIIKRTVVNNLAPVPPQPVEQPAALTQPMVQPPAPPQPVDQPVAGIEELSSESADPRAFLVTVIRPLIKLLRAVRHWLSLKRINGYSSLSKKHLVDQMKSVKKPLQTLCNTLKTIMLKDPVSTTEAEAFMNAASDILKLSVVDDNVKPSFKQIERYVLENESGLIEYWQKLIFLMGRFNLYLEEDNSLDMT